MTTQTHYQPDSSSDSDDARTPDTQNVLVRGIVMIVLAIFFGFGEAILGLLMITQFFWLLITRTPNQFIVRFGKSLSIWFSQAARFQVCESEIKPFPWSAWPDASRADSL